MQKSILDALNEQINRELFSWYLYKSMSAYFSDINLDGFASWMGHQAMEEMQHAEKIYQYILERGGRIELKAIDTPQHEWQSPQAAMEASLEHEKFISKSIHDIVEIAQKEKDHATSIFLQWFVTEQVEEEASVLSIVERMKNYGDFKGGLFMMDRELMMRK